MPKAPDARFLIVRHPLFRRNFFDVICDWVQQHYPQQFQLFDVRSLPCLAPHWPTVSLHIPWLQDPVQQWSLPSYFRANQLAAKCDELGIPVINRVDRLINATKFRGSLLMKRVGICSPQMALIKNAQEFHETQYGLKLPLFVREDWGHWGLIKRADTMEEVRQIPLHRFKRPVAIERINAAGRKDGLFRKYRYIAAGNAGVSHHLQTSAEWITRGKNRVLNDTTRGEEMEYISRQDPHHELFQSARRALELDFIAFDYGYDQTGQMIVWGANPFPHIVFSQRSLKYRNAALDRTILAVLILYLNCASLQVTDEMESKLAYS